MGALPVINFHSLAHHLARLEQVLRALLQKFLLKDSVDPLGQGVLIAVVTVSHRAGDAVPGVQTLVVSRAILNAAIGVMHQQMSRRALAQGQLKRASDRFGLQSFMDVMANNLTRVSVGY